MRKRNLLNTNVDTHLESKAMLDEASEHLGSGGSLADYSGEKILDVKQLVQNSTSSSAEVLQAAEDFIDEYTSGDNQATGIRVPIFFHGQSFNTLRFNVVNEIIAHADDAGLEIYANPAGAGNLLPDDARASSDVYSARINQFINSNPELDYIGAFNEPGLSLDFMNDVMDDLNVPTDVQTVGPDIKLLRTTDALLDSQDGRDFLGRFDVLGAHNLAENGRAGDVSDWDDLKAFAASNGQEIWDTEALDAGDHRNRVVRAELAGVDGIVLYEPSNNVNNYPA